MVVYGKQFSIPISRRDAESRANSEDTYVPCGRKTRKRKINKHKRKKRMRANRHKKKLR